MTTPTQALWAARGRLAGRALASFASLVRRGLGVAGRFARAHLPALIAVPVVGGLVWFFCWMIYMAVTDDFTATAAEIRAARASSWCAERWVPQTAERVAREHNNRPLQRGDLRRALSECAKAQRDADVRAEQAEALK